VATPETEARLLKVGRAGTADHVERIVRGWRRMDRKAEGAEAQRQHVHRALHVYQDEDGMVVFRGTLAPEVGAMLIKALAVAREALYQQALATRAEIGLVIDSVETPPREQQQADALALLAETALITGSIPAPRASAIRSSSTSTPPCSRTPISPASPSSRTACAFPQKRLSAWRATRAAW
jgi:hypothetical protein